MKVIIYGNFYGEKGHKNRMDKFAWYFYKFIQENSKYDIVIKDETENIESICDKNTILFVIAGITPKVDHLTVFKKIYDYIDVSCRCGYKCLGYGNCKSRHGINYVKTFDYILNKYDTYIVREHLKDKILKYPYFIDNNVFRDWKLEKKYDILFFGNTWRKIYPLRFRLYHLLKKHKEINCLFLEYNDQNHAGMFTGAELSKLINQSWLTVACKSIGDLLFQKYYEIAFSNSVVFGDYPDLEHNYFGDNMVYVDISMSDNEIIDKLKYALSDKDKLIKQGNTVYEYFTKHFEYKNGLEYFDNFVDDIIQ